MGTIPGLLLEATRRYSKPNAFQFKQSGHWINVSSEEFIVRVEEVFHGLQSLGIRAGDRVAILSENRVEWAICDYAAQSLGAVVVPIYPTMAAAQVEFLLQDCAARLIFVSTLELLEKIVVCRKRLVELSYVIAFDPRIYQPGVMRLETLYKIGNQGVLDHPDAFCRSVDALQPESVATIIYTSGTTGLPKGAMLTHRNLVSNIRATLDILPLNSNDVELSFLPLSHIFQRHADYASMLAGATIAYAENLNTVGDNMMEVRPTFAAGVPRFFEKIRSRILADVHSGPGLRRRVFHWALCVGMKAVRTSQRGFQYSLADRLVLRKIREHLGGRLRWFISGGAALEKEVAEFFFAIGIPVLEGYGLTETAPVIALNGPDDFRIGSVGKPVGDVEVRVAADGEILVRGSNVMKGYFGRLAETSEALRDGWFHTGDIGQVTTEGYLQITDRKKDLIITSSGKNVAPQPIENRLKLVPYFDNVVLIGDRRHFLTALIVPNMDAIMEYARDHQIEFEEPRELLQRREIYDLAMNEIDRRSSDLSNYERVRKVAFLKQAFSIDGGELTPTLKIRRSVIEKKFRESIEELYAA